VGSGGAWDSRVFKRGVLGWGVLGCMINTWRKNGSCELQGGLGGGWGHTYWGWDAGTVVGVEGRGGGRGYRCGGGWFGSVRLRGVGLVGVVTRNCVCGVVDGGVGKNWVKGDCLSS